MQIDITKAKHILRSLGVKYRVINKPGPNGALGYASTTTAYVYTFDTIYFLNKHKDISVSYKRCSTEQILSTMFHEAAHVLLYRQGMYKTYHEGIIPNKTSRAKFERWAAQMLDAERSADILGKALLKKHFPTVRFISIYTGQKGSRYVRLYIDWLRKTYYDDL